MFDAFPPMTALQNLHPSFVQDPIALSAVGRRWKGFIDGVTVFD